MSFFLSASESFVGSDLSDSRNVYPVKALRASSAALRPAVTRQPLPLKVVRAESGAFGQLGRMNLLLGRSQLDKERGLPLVRQSLPPKAALVSVASMQQESFDAPSYDR